MKLAMYQTAGIPRDPTGNLARLPAVAAEAASAGAEVLALPEMWLTGYDIGPAVSDLAEPADGPSAAAVAGICRRERIAILYGYPERAGGRVYNAARFIGADGSPIGNMRKAHLFGPGERALYTPGDTGLPVFAVAGLTVGVLICYDVEFPEAVRSQVLRGADLVIVPTALFRPFAFVADHLVAVRAWENGIHVAYINRCGRERETVYVGGSRLCAPDGSMLAGAQEGETLLVADVTPAAFRGDASPNSYLQDRRPELYGA